MPTLPSSSRPNTPVRQLAGDELPDAITGASGPAQLAFAVATEFGNLMTVMAGYGEMIVAAAAAGEPPIPEHVAELRRAAERGRALSCRLIALSRFPPEGLMPLDLRPLNAARGAALDRQNAADDGHAVNDNRRADTVHADVIVLSRNGANLDGSDG